MTLRTYVEQSLPRGRGGPTQTANLEGHHVMALETAQPKQTSRTLLLPSIRKIGAGFHSTGQKSQRTSSVAHVAIEGSPATNGRWRECRRYVAAAQPKPTSKTIADQQADRRELDSSTSCYRDRKALSADRAGPTQTDIGDAIAASAIVNRRCGVCIGPVLRNTGCAAIT